jgi:LysM repeat protein
MRHFFLFLIFILPITVMNITAQDSVPVRKSENKVIIDGKVYTLHVVKPGQTLYSIANAYGVDKKNIAIENPGVYAGIRIGQVLKIPDEVPEIKQDIYSGIDTSKFILYPLKENESVFSLSSRFNVPLSEIEKANPDLDYSKLQIGQIILIPKTKLIISDNSYQNYETYKVRRKDTFYSLTRKFNVSEEALKALNPELQWGGLKAGQLIKIPNEKIAEVVNEPLPLDSASTLNPYSEAFIDSLEVLSLYDYDADLKSYNGKELNVAYLIPFNYYMESDTIISDNEDDNAMKEESVVDDNFPKAVNFLEFMEGSLLALDSVNRSGLKLNVNFYDTRKSPTRVREILASDSFRDVDLIIGPFYSWNVEIVSEYSRENKIPLISPFYAERELTESNPYLFQLNPSYIAEYDLAASYLAEKFEYNYVFIYNSDSLELPKIEYFKNSLFSELEKHTHFENILLKEIVYDNAAKAKLSADLEQSLSKDKKNIVIVPESDEAFTSIVVSQLFFQLGKFDIEVFGMPQWSQFENAEFNYYHPLNLQYLTPYYFSYDDENILNFLKLYKKSYFAEPSMNTRKGCPYAFLGFDATYSFLEIISRYNRSFIRHLDDMPENSVMPKMNFIKTKPWGGFENNELRLVIYHDDYSISVEEVNHPKPINTFPNRNRIFRYNSYEEDNSPD